MESRDLKKISKETKIKLNVTGSNDKCIKGLEPVSDIIKHQGKSAIDATAKYKTLDTLDFV
eukprot:4755745-Ditylum_brightwellii.AAC.1